MREKFHAFFIEQFVAHFASYSLISESESNQPMNICNVHL